MKKSSIFLVSLLLLFSISITLAAENQTTNQTTTSATSNSDSTSDKTVEGFKCLEEKAGHCKSLTTEEIALTILATPDNIFDDCVKELKKKQSSNHWENIKDTALAILALKHAGEDTESAEEWLIKQNRTPLDLVWYLQEDSNAKTECHIGYNAQDFTINIGENKKINKNAGKCLIRAQQNFWLEISSKCYDQEFKIECDKDFISSLLYKNKKSSTIYVLDKTTSSPAYGSITLGIKSKCFGENKCDYEATVWATVALMETGHNIEEYIPYIIASSETSEKYLPEAFIYILTNYEDYASSLIAKQKLGNYWEAKSSAYNQYYDTGLALIALGSSSAEQISKAKEWLLFSQGTNGCWQNSVRDTAIILWALEGKSGKSKSAGSVTYCSEANYFCIPSADCPSSENVGNNYFCASLSDTCCIHENLKTCSEYAGKKCSETEVCTGNERKASDTNNCCTGSCQEKPQDNECEKNFYTCMDSCSEFQEPMSTYSCDKAQVCCRMKSKKASTSHWWIWLLVILILLALGILAYIYRDNLKLYYFQLKTKFKKDDGKNTGGAMPPTGPRPGFPPRANMRPRPGFPPIRRPQRRPLPRRSYDRRDKAMTNTFKQLREMSR